MRNKGFTVSLIGIGAVVLVGLLFMTEHHSNCGGNSAALSDCRRYAYAALARVMELHTPLVTNAVYGQVYGEFDRNRDYPYSPDLLDEEGLSQVPPPSGWTGHAQYLIRTNSIAVFGSKERKVMIVCIKPFSNVPQRRFFKNPPRHAVAYSDGKTGLISTKTFAALDLSNFAKTEAYLSQRKVQPAPGTLR